MTLLSAVNVITKSIPTKEPTVLPQLYPHLRNVYNSATPYS